MKRIFAKPIKYLHRGIPRKITMAAFAALILVSAMFGHAVGDTVITEVKTKYTAIANAAKGDEMPYDEFVEQETDRVMNMAGFKAYMYREARHIALMAIGQKTSNEQILLDMQ